MGRSASVRRIFEESAATEQTSIPRSFSQMALGCASPPTFAVFRCRPRINHRPAFYGKQIAIGLRSELHARNMPEPARSLGFPSGITCGCGYPENGCLTIEARHNSPGSVNGRTIAWFGNGEALILRCFKPKFDSDFSLGNCFRRRITMRRTRFKIGDIRNPALVFFRPENIDVIMMRHHSSSVSPNSSTISRNCRT